MKELTLEAAVENLDKVLAFVNAELERADCAAKTQMQLELAVEEIFVNIASYAYAPGTGTATVRVEVTDDPPEAAVTFLDSGVPYDPLQREDPDVTLPAEDREAGGLGIFITRNVMDEVSYAYTDGQNVLTLRKKL